MQSLSQFKNPGIQYLFTDIDDTLTDHGQLGAEAYDALWKLHQKGIKVIPVTGRPAGWCEMIARLWPVDGIVGENGGFYFRYHKNKMHRSFVVSEKDRIQFRRKLDDVIAPEILAKVPGSAIASDQFCRLLDLAIDFCEDVKPLPIDQVQKIVDIFTDHGAQAKVSSIHVNGWFGTYNKLSMCEEILKKEFSVDIAQAKQISAFVGDSPNDEPMFGYFPYSFAVANVQKFADRLKSKPKFVASHEGGKGFAEISKLLL